MRQSLFQKEGEHVNFIRSLYRWNKLFNNTMLTIAGVILICSMLLIVINGFVRIFTVPFGATVEVVSWCAAIVTVFSLGATQISKGHVSIDIITNKFPKIVQRVLDIIFTIIAIAFFSLVSYQMYLYGMSLKGTLSSTLRIEYWPLLIVVAFGFISLITTLLINLLYLVTGMEEEEEWIQEQSL